MPLPPPPSFLFSVFSVGAFYFTAGAIAPPPASTVSEFAISLPAPRILQWKIAARCLYWPIAPVYIQYTVEL